MISMDKQRCNDCGAVFDEELTACPKCGRDDCLMYPFEQEEVFAKPPPPSVDSSGIPLCPVCNGERELSGIPGLYICYHCGLMGSP